MGRVWIGTPSPDLILGVATDARRADRDEIEAATGSTAIAALRRSLDLSTHALAGTIDGRPAAVFGVGPASLASGIGVPWFVGARVLDAHPRPLVALSRHYLGMVTRLYPHLENLVDSRNAAAIRWLSWLGFTIHPARPFGPYGLPFHRFTWGW